MVTITCYNESLCVIHCADKIRRSNHRFIMEEIKDSGWHSSASRHVNSSIHSLTVTLNLSWSQMNKQELGGGRKKAQIIATVLPKF